MKNFAGIRDGSETECGAIRALSAKMRLTDVAQGQTARRVGGPACLQKGDDSGHQEDAASLNVLQEHASFTNT
jgi:hypothetical protein